MTGVFGENSGGDLFTTFKPGLEKAYVRFYTKFAADHGYEHHFVAMGGYTPATPWPNPKAGTRPNGDDRLAIFIDPVGFYGRYPPPGVWTLYSYWSEMKISADGKYWGNVLAPVNALLIALFAGWVVRKAVVDEEFESETSAWKAYWRVANRYLAPTALVIVLIDLIIGWEHILQTF